MTVTIPDILRRIRHFYPDTARHREWRTEGGALYPTDQIPPDTWIAIVDRGPVGVYHLDENGASPALPDRQWTGTVWTLKLPSDLLRLCEDIIVWAAQHEPALSRETVGEHTVQREQTCWEFVFAASLAPYMRMYPEVAV